MERRKERKVCSHNRLIAEFEVAAASVLASKAIALVNSSGIRNLLMILRAI